MMLQRCRVDFLSGEDIQTVIVSIGNYKDIPRFREETGFAGEIYVDTDLMSPKCFQLLRFENGKHVLFQDPEGTQIHPRTIEAAQRSSVSLPDGGYGLDDNPYTGDTLQVFLHFS